MLTIVQKRSGHEVLTKLYKYGVAELANMQLAALGRL
jgi:hypothetical protein